MANVDDGTSFTLDGTSDFQLGGEFFQWHDNWLPFLLVAAENGEKGISVHVNFSGSNLTMSALRFEGQTNMKVEVTDNTVGGGELFLDALVLSHGGSTVQLTNMTMHLLKTGNGDDDVSTGDGFISHILLGNGTNTLTTGGGWVDAIVARDADDKATIGSGGAGSVNLGHGDNMVRTGDGWVDSIVTRSGDDEVAIGAGGAEFAALGDGADTLILSSLSNADNMVTVQGGSGFDTVDFSAFKRGIEWDADNGFSEGRDGKFLTMSFESVIGTRRADDLMGNSKANTIDGGRGGDHIAGLGGADDLTGGAGRDRFIFFSADDSKKSAKGRDLITDFTKKDRIDLSDFDANPKRDGVQGFDFIGEQAFSRKAGELRVEQSDEETFVYGDLNGDGKVDFAIEIDGSVNLKAGDFVL